VAVLLPEPGHHLSQLPSLLAGRSDRATDGLGHLPSSVENLAQHLDRALGGRLGLSPGGMGEDGQTVPTGDAQQVTGALA
jgi:hypothetical protein